MQPCHRLERRRFEVLDPRGELGSPRGSALPVANSAGDSFGQRSGPQATFALACRSVGAGVRPGVGRVVRASEAIVVKATANEVPPTAEVLAAGMCHGTCVKAISAAFAKSSNPTGAKTTHVSSTEAADVASAKATHVTSSTEAAHTAAVSAATSTSTSGFCARGNQAPGQ